MNKTKRCKHDNETDQRVVRSDERWRKVPDEMPTGYEDVLVWYREKIRRGYWIEREDTREMWHIEGISGGIGTAIQVGPPEYWRPMVKGPKGET